jgi:hypothetical protein
MLYDCLLLPEPKNRSIMGARRAGRILVADSTWRKNKDPSEMYLWQWFCFYSAEVDSGVFIRIHFPDQSTMTSKQ